MSSNFISFCVARFAEVKAAGKRNRRRSRQEKRKRKGSNSCLAKPYSSLVINKSTTSELANKRQEGTLSINQNKSKKSWLGGRKFKKRKNNVKKGTNIKQYARSEKKRKSMKILLVHMPIFDSNLLH